MVYIHNGTEYRSKKFPVLEYVFNKLTENGSKGMTQNHTFTLKDVSEGYRACGIPEPASISNTTLDLKRTDRGINSRLPLSLIQLGYDLRKKTGKTPTGEKYCGEFVYVGVGNAIRSWHIWADEPDQRVVVKNNILEKVAKYLGKDEAALFSAIDYCDVLSVAIYGHDHPGTILRIQNPMKWQPNEIDGLYISDFEGSDTFYPVEAKALSTKDALSLEQMLDAYQMIKKKVPDTKVIPLGIQMIENGMRIGVFREADDHLEISTYIQVNFDPPIRSWQSRPRRNPKSKTMPGVIMERLFPYEP